MQVFVGHIGGLGYSATRKGGKPVRGLKNADQGGQLPLVKSQQADRLETGADGLAQRRQSYDPTSLFVSDANHDGRGTRTVDGIVRNQNGWTTE